MSGSSRRRISIRATTIVAALFVFGTALAQAAFRVDVPPQPLADALRAVGQQTSTNILFEPDLVKGLRAAAVRADLTSDEALATLLKGTGLAAQRTSADTIVIKRAAAPPTSLSTSGGGDPLPSPGYGRGAGGEGMRVAQADQGMSTSANSSSANQNSDTSSDSQGQKVEPYQPKIPEVLVKGSKLLDMDIKRTPDDPQPYVVFDREQIAQSGATSLEDFFKNRLTMNTVSGVNAQSDLTGLSGNQSQINLRGLGTNQTLILIDGHRTSSVNSFGTPQQFDINGIPLAAIERIEILPTTASAIYGGSATGGAVNIILRRDYSGLETRLTYDRPFTANAGLGTANLSAGFNLEDGKTNVLIAGTYSDGSNLAVGDRDFLQRGRAAILANNANNYQIFTDDNGRAPLGGTPNIASADGSNLVLNNGTPLNSPITYVPVGYAGTADGGAALVANAGKYNLNLANTLQYSGGRLSSLEKTPTLESLTTTLRRQFGPRVQAFLEASASSNAGDYRSSFAVFRPFDLPAGTANNPFRQEILVTVPTNSAPSTTSSTDVNHRLMGGVIVSLPGAWTSEADYTWDQSRFSFHVGPGSLTPAASAAVTAGSIDIMRDTNAYPVDFSPYLNHGTDTQIPFRTTLKDASLRFAGPVGISLPAGEPQIATLLEHRDVDLSDGSYGGGTFLIFDPGRSQSVDSAYAEVRVPLVSSKNSVAGIRELELQISGRHDEYTTHGVSSFLCCTATAIANTVITRSVNKIRSTDPLFALRYQPVQDVVLRGSYGTGFLPPAVDQIVPRPVSSDPCIAPDPLRGNTLASFPCVFGGNSHLQPEQSKSWSAGLILTPRVLRDLRVSVDYTNIRKTDNITSVSQSDIATLEALGRITRGPNLPGDQPGWAGPITFADDSLVNLLKAQIQAYDVQFDYKLSTAGEGVFNFFALGTWETHYKTQAAAGSPFVENVGVGSSNPLKFKANAGATWTRRQWTVGWSANYFDSYWVNAAHTVDVNQGSDHIPSQIYHDLFATYRFDAGMSRNSVPSDVFSGLEITLGLKNILNKQPPFDASNTFFYYSTFGDPRLASYWLSVKKAF